MKNICTIAVFAGLLLAFGSCAPTGAPVYTLGIPRFAPQSQPDSSADVGIGEDPKIPGNNILLQWYKSQGATGYKVWRTDSIEPNGFPTAFSQVSIPPVVTDTVYSDPVLVGVPYYYYLTAIGGGGKGESSPSDTLRYTLVPRPLLQYPGPNNPMDTNKLTFGWQQDPTSGSNAVIRVENTTENKIIWVSKRFSSYLSTGSKVFNDDGRAIENLTQANEYRWRVDLFVDSTQGARSMWQTFVVN
jgi:hypothetical protein